MCSLPTKLLPHRIFVPFSCVLQMGYAQGSMMADEVRGFINDVWEYFEEQACRAVSCHCGVAIVDPVRDGFRWRSTCKAFPTGYLRTLLTLDWMLHWI